MINSGLVSITFRHLSAGEIIELAAEAGLSGIEWGGDVHVRHGDLECARQTGRITREAGLEVVTYGSYYRLGLSESEGLPFTEVLETALAMEAPVIRIWAGNRNAEDIDAEGRRRLFSEAKRVALLAKDAGVSLAFEYHDGSLTNTALSTRRLLDELACDNIWTFWQPIHGAGVVSNTADLRMLTDKVINAHVFHWWPGDKDRCLLEDGYDHWKSYLGQLSQSGRDHYAMLEFVKDDDINNFISDANTLKSLLDEINSGSL